MDPSGNNLRTQRLDRRTLAWSCFDMVTSCYFGIVPATLFPLYFTKHVAAGDDVATTWGLVVMVATLASGLAALGTAALTRYVSRLWLMGIFVSLLSVGLVVLSSEYGGTLWIAAGTFVAMQCCYFCATAIYESYLPQIAPPERVHWLSGFGWTLGYVGGISTIVIVLLTTKGQAEGTAAYQNAFAITALATIFFAIPVFALMKGTGFAQTGAMKSNRQWTGAAVILSNWSEHRATFRLVLGVMLVNLPIAALVAFTAPLLATQFGQSLSDLLQLLIILHVISVPSVYFVAVLTERWSGHWPIMIVFFAWGMVLILLAFFEGRWVPWLIAGALGICVGSTSATMRGIFAAIVPRSQSAGFFAIWTLAGRIAAALGPLLFSVAAARFGKTAALEILFGILTAGAAIVLTHIRRQSQSR